MTANAHRIPPCYHGAVDLSGFRRDIEGLRGIAILLVVAYHVGLPGISGGYVGVDVFFVLSGFLITSLLVKELSTTGHINLVEFYARRARRILPAAALVSVSTLLFGYWLYPPVEQLRYTETAIAAAAYSSNLWFAKEAMNYLAPDSLQNPFLHTWSLSVEEQFYLVWPCFLLLVGRGREVQQRDRIRVAILAVLVLSCAVAVRETHVQQPTAFFGSHARAWEFAAGGTVAFLRLSDRVRMVAQWFGAAAIVCAVLALNDGTPYPGVAALLPVVGTIGLLLGPTTSVIGTLLESRPLQVIGRYSYSWYLWHWPVLVFGESVLGPTTLFVRVALALLALGLSVVTFRVLENPVRRAAALVQRPRWSLAATMALTVLVVVAGLAARSVGRLHAASEPQRSFAAAALDIPPLYENGCHLPRAGVAVSACEFGDKASTRTIVLFGDSHAAQWLPALERIGIEQHLKVVAMTKSACPAPEVEPFKARLNRGYTECTQWREAAFEWMRQHRPLAVVASSATGRYVPSRASQEQWVHGLRAMVETLTSAGVPILWLRDTPSPGFDPPACLARNFWNPAVFSHGCEFAPPDRRSDQTYGAEAQAVLEAPGGATLDVAGAICQGAVCRSQIDHLVVFRDSHHLTTKFALTLTSSIAEKLAAMGIR